MSQRNIILNQLKTDMKNKISTANGYSTTPAEIRRGIHMFDDFSLKPAISFWNYRDEKYEATIRQLYIYVYMYTDTDGLGDVDSIYDLADDVETFLYSTDHTNTNGTEVGDITIYEGGTSDPACLAQLEITIKYSYGRKV